MGFIEFMLNFAWRLLAIGFGFMLFRYILKNGSGTFREILDVIFIGGKAALIAIRKKLVEWLKKQEKEEVEDNPKPNVKAEGSVM